MKWLVENWKQSGVVYVAGVMTGLIAAAIIGSF